MSMVNLNKVLFIVSGFPATGVWFAWYFSAWNLMIFCLLLSVPIMIIDLYIRRTYIARLIEITAMMFFYIPFTVFAFAKLYEERGLLFNGEVVHSFSDSLYFSVVTWTTLGYGYFQPVESARIWAATEALVGYLFMAALISLIMTFVASNRNNA